MFGNIKNMLLLTDRKKMLINFKANFYLPILAFCFLVLSVPADRKYRVCIFLAVLCWGFIAAQIDSIWQWIKTKNRILIIFNFVTAIGICWAEKYVFCNNYFKFFHKHHIVSSQSEMAIISHILGLFAVIFLIIVLTYFLEKLLFVLKEIDLLKSIYGYERYLYIILFLLVCFFITIVFLNTDFFYGTKYSCDIVYTADSQMIVKPDCYLRLLHHQNDVRQPLFAVFTAPFCGISYFIAKIICKLTHFNFLVTKAILTDYVQIALIFYANFVLTKIFDFNRIKRICFILLISSTYTYLLSLLMMEQFVSAYFWLIIALYSICKNKINYLTLWGAGATLSTSLILIPCASKNISKNYLFRSIKEWLLIIPSKCYAGYAVLLILFGRFDIFIYGFKKIVWLMRFSGKEVTFLNKVYQYMEFVHNIILSPNIVEKFTNNIARWHLAVPVHINWVGAVILVLVIVSVIVNYKKLCNIVAGCWVVFSILILFVIGWGTKENGLILYSLYFAWAFFVLLFQLLEFFENKLQTDKLIPVITAVGCTYMFFVNSKAIMDMVNFGIKYYPLVK